VTSGAYGHRVGKSIALGYIPKELATADSGFEIELIGEMRKATRQNGAPFDASGARMRA
jgi:dimethylglycine dehydrogenase